MNIEIYPRGSNGQLGSKIGGPIILFLTVVAAEGVKIGIKFLYKKYKEHKANKQPIC